MVSRASFIGTHKGDLQGIAPTGKTVSASVIFIDRFDGDKVAENWTNFDELTMLQQLGAVAPAGFVLDRVTVPVRQPVLDARHEPPATAGAPYPHQRREGGPVVSAALGEQVAAHLFDLEAHVLAPRHRQFGPPSPPPAEMRRGSLPQIGEGNGPSFRGLGTASSRHGVRLGVARLFAHGAQVTAFVPCFAHWHLTGPQLRGRFGCPASRCRATNMPNGCVVRCCIRETACCY